MAVMSANTPHTITVYSVKTAPLYSLCEEENDSSSDVGERVDSMGDSVGADVGERDSARVGAPVGWYVVGPAVGEVAGAMVVMGLNLTPGNSQISGPKSSWIHHSRHGHQRDVPPGEYSWSSPFPPPTKLLRRRCRPILPLSSSNRGGNICRQ